MMWIRTEIYLNREDDNDAIRVFNENQMYKLSTIQLGNLSSTTCAHRNCEEHIYIEATINGYDVTTTTEKAILKD